MPYIIEVTKPTSFSYLGSHSHWSRFAVRTLEEAREYIVDEIVDYDLITDNGVALSENGGTVKCANGITFVVRYAEWSQLARSCDPPLSISGSSGQAWTTDETDAIMKEYHDHG